jgi:hypothetical protein
VDLLGVAVPSAQHALAMEAEPGERRLRPRVVEIRVGAESLEPEHVE